MRAFGTTTALVALLTLTGCGAVGTDPDDVPTITTRPSAPAPTSTIAAPSASPSSPTSTSSASSSSSEPDPGDASPTSVPPPTSAPPPDRPRGPASYVDAVARVAAAEAAGPVVRTDRFVTPGDDVYCLLADPFLGPACELGNGFIADPDVCGADSTDRVGRIETFRGRPRAVCNADTIREPGAELVRAPAAVVSGTVSCAVAKSGVTCVDRGTATGFYLGKGEYHVYR